MKVLHVTPYYAPEVEFGGPPASVHELCRALKRAGVDVHVVTTACKPSEDVVDGVAVTRVRRRTRLGFAGAMDRLLDAELQRADVCHIHALFNWPAWRAASRARRLGRPIVVSPRGMLERPALAHHAWRKRVAWQLFDRHLVARASAIVASTEDEALSLRANGLSPAVVPNGVEAPNGLPSRGAFRTAHAIAADAPVITFLGRLHPIKRLDLLAAAFREVAAKRCDAVLVLAGPDEAVMWPTLQNDLAAVIDRVRWTGPLAAAEKWQMLVDSDVLVLCSDSESYGRVVAEGLSAGVPAVVTDTCPWPMLEREGIGRIVPQSAHAIADAVNGLLATDALSFRAMTIRAREYAANHFRWERVVPQYVALYQSLLAPSSVTAVAPQAGF